jgi:hypothetical protein
VTESDGEGEKMNLYTAQKSVEIRQQEMLREADQHRLAQEIQADQILSRWVLSLLRRSVSEPNQPTSAKPAAQKRVLVRDGG